MTEQEIAEIADAVAARLSDSVLKLPDEVPPLLKEWQGWTYRGPICGGRWPIHIETRITTDGGIQVQLVDAMSTPVFRRVLHP